MNITLYWTINYMEIYFLLDSNTTWPSDHVPKSHVVTWPRGFMTCGHVGLRHVAIWLFDMWPRGMRAGGHVGTCYVGHVAESFIDVVFWYTWRCGHVVIVTVIVATWI
jgi:hypothetical protein